MLRAKIWILAVALTLTVGQANADSYTDFTLSGIFTDPYKDTWSLTGNIVVDGTTDLITGASIRLVGEPWTNIVSQGLSGGNYDVSIQTPISNTGCSGAGNCFDTLTLALSAPPSMLVADGAGSIVSGYAELYDAGFAVSLVTGTGSLVDPPSATPLPATLPLFATGLGVIGLLSRRGKRKIRAAAV
jgi:hypothetical protein